MEDCPGRRQTETPICRLFRLPSAGTGADGCGRVRTARLGSSRTTFGHEIANLLTKSAPRRVRTGADGCGRPAPGAPGQHLVMKSSICLPNLLPDGCGRVRTGQSSKDLQISGLGNWGGGGSLGFPWISLGFGDILKIAAPRRRISYVWVPRWAARRRISPQSSP